MDVTVTGQTLMKASETDSKIFENSNVMEFAKMDELAEIPLAVLSSELGGFEKSDAETGSKEELEEIDYLLNLTDELSAAYNEGLVSNVESLQSPSLVLNTPDKTFISAASNEVEKEKLALLRYLKLERVTPVPTEQEGTETKLETNCRCLKIGTNGRTPVVNYPRKTCFSEKCLLDLFAGAFFQWVRASYPHVFEEAHNSESPSPHPVNGLDGKDQI